jgi:hypothetical protein
MSNVRTIAAVRRHRMPGTVFRLGLGAFALAIALVQATAGARAQQSSSEESAYCAQLAGLYSRYHFNLYHPDGTWARAELAKLDCTHGKPRAGTRELEHILRNDRFVIRNHPVPAGGIAER